MPPELMITAVVSNEICPDAPSASVPVLASLLREMAALPLMSASTIVPSAICAEATVLSAASEPASLIVESNCVPVWFALASGSVASFESAMAALALMSESTIVPSVICAEATALSAASVPASEIVESNCEPV